ncbi:hypothetical protein [Haloarcula onubensis]|uniref:Uncharacterized protein n=1 Tax=Haloarcula onubensis TaxID=2950539 RepID=A0ABU2FJF1_9EURY|nr:hypothetical protein [Halomicroarcula sp. S3CR25-11]MDS0280885.1 hypothetical protein [Halomicroarcula sp. S3CR25-11]
MSCPQTDEDTASASPAVARPGHNWRPTVVQGALLWLVVGTAWLLPLAGPLSLGTAAVSVFVAPVLPVALCCDYRQARANGECGAGVGAYLRNLAADVLTTVRDREPLGSARW